MNFSEIDALARYELADDIGAGSADAAVTPDAMLAFVNEAVNEACRRARILVDSSTAAICQIPIVAGTSVYTFDERIIFIKRGMITGGKKALNKASHVIMDENIQGWEGHTGEAETFVTGLYSNKLRLYKVPNSNGMLNLTVIRTPLVALAGGDDVPEIPARYHQALILWVKHKVFNRQDSEVFDRNKADIHLMEFERYFGKRCAADDVFDEMHLLRDFTDGYDSSSDYY
jgi:hypothetical protein